MNEPVVDVRGLHVRFGEVEAVAGIDVQAYAGQATALLGRNGAGKSTTMRVLAGVVPPTEGTVTVAGHDIRTETLTVKQLTGYCPDVGGLVPRATSGPSSAGVEEGGPVDVAVAEGAGSHRSHRRPVARPAGSRPPGRAG